MTRDPVDLRTYLNDVEAQLTALAAALPVPASVSRDPGFARVRLRTTNSENPVTITAALNEGEAPHPGAHDWLRLTRDDAEGKTTLLTLAWLYPEDTTPDRQDDARRHALAGLVSPRRPEHARGLNASADEATGIYASEPDILAVLRADLCLVPRDDRPSAGHLVRKTATAPLTGRKSTPTAPLSFPAQARQTQPHGPPQSSDSHFLIAETLAPLIAHLAKGAPLDPDQAASLVTHAMFTIAATNECSRMTGNLRTSLGVRLKQMFRLAAVPTAIATEGWYSSTGLAPLIASSPAALALLGVMPFILAAGLWPYARTKAAKAGAALLILGWAGLLSGLSMNRVGAQLQSQLPGYSRIAPELRKTVAVLEERVQLADEALLRTQRGTAESQTAAARAKREKVALEILKTTDANAAAAEKKREELRVALAQARRDLADAIEKDPTRDYAGYLALVLGTIVMCGGTAALGTYFSNAEDEHEEARAESARQRFRELQTRSLTLKPVQDNLAQACLVTLESMLHASTEPFTAKQRREIVNKAVAAFRKGRPARGIMRLFQPG